MATLLLLIIGLPVLFRLIRFSIGLICTVLSGALNITANAIDRAEQRKAAQIKSEQKQTVYENQLARKQAARVNRIERAEQARRREAERAERERVKAEQAERVKAFRIETARADLVHLEQLKRDLLKCYNVAMARYESAEDDAEREKALLKCMAYDNRARSIEKQIEKNRFIIGGE